MRPVPLLCLAVSAAACGGHAGPAPYARPATGGKKLVVRLALDGEVPERSQPGFLGERETRSLYEWTSLADRIRRDADVAAVLLEIRSIGCDWACTDELARAFEAVRASGRRVHCA